MAEQDLNSNAQIIFFFSKTQLELLGLQCVKAPHPVSSSEKFKMPYENSGNTLLTLIFSLEKELFGGSHNLCGLE